MRDAWGKEGGGCPGARGARIGAPRRIFPLARSPALGVKFSATRRGTENAFQREARPSHAGFGNGNAREVDAPSRLRVPSRRTRVANRVHSRRARQGGAGRLPVLGLGSRPDAAHVTKAALCEHPDRLLRREKRDVSCHSAHVVRERPRVAPRELGPPLARRRRLVAPLHARAFRIPRRARLGPRRGSLGFGRAREALEDG